MYHYYLYPNVTYNIVLILSALVPAILLMVRIYRKDKLEKENGRLLRRLVVAGILSSLIAMVLEKVTYSILSQTLYPNSLLFRILLYFVIVGVSEEGAKLFMLRRSSWNSIEFNCFFDGVVYAVFVSLGFALWENIDYVLNYGFATAVVRALTAIPGHASFGVFMGVFYSAAKLYMLYGERGRSGAYLFLSLLVPVLLHGTYDYIATMDMTSWNPYFLGFIVILFISANLVVNSVSRNDRYMIMEEPVIYEPEDPEEY